MTPITLALQGGGTHGAFAWGAIDQLLSSGRVEIKAITAVSGGAMNAVVLADALTREEPDGGREALAHFWRKVSVAASLLPFRPTVMDKMLSTVGIDLSPASIALDYLTKIFSPYQFNLFDLNPLRAILEEVVDFERLREQKKIRLFINATDVRTGKSRVFTGDEITLDAVMASACLPFLFRTVTVDDVPYWDGSYSGNPALMPLLDTNLPRDVVLIQTTSPMADEVPTQATDILDRATEISFANALAEQLKLVEMHNKMNPKSALTMHMIEASDLMAAMGRGSKLNAEGNFLSYLHDLGSQAAADWLETTGLGIPTKRAQGE